MSLQGKYYKQRYYINIISLRPSRPVLISGKVKSENVTAGEKFHTTILLDR